MEAIMQVAMQNPTYESDYYAIEQLLDQYGYIYIYDGLCLREDCEDVYTLEGPSGNRHTHLLKEYAIHHLLCLYYGRSMSAN
ncbi:hypothetical protein LJB76_02925 [Clostridia bacterium OttesenSCG-928-O13]|nr:hypothetical protein [Clostridia bacterium OttesenSCG-928-O13]